MPSACRLASYRSDTAACPKQDGLDRGGDSAAMMVRCTHAISITITTTTTTTITTTTTGMGMVTSTVMG